MAKKIPVGVQLYSVREQAGKDLPGVLKSVKEMGYDAVEFAGYYGYSAYDVKKLLDQVGLKACGTHTGLDQLLGENFQKTVDFHKVIAAEYVNVPWMPKERRNSVPAIAQTAKLFNELAEKLQPFGMKIGYHAHGDDFTPISKRNAWEILFASTSSDVMMQMDTGNAMEGGADPVAMITQFPGRCETIHLKEFGGPHGAVVGEGNVKWQEVFDFCQTAGGTKWYIVEHEVQGVDAMASIAKFRAGLKKFGI
jgi:sugar phosphate isomerase/epimerase